MTTSVVVIGKHFDNLTVHHPQSTRSLLNVLISIRLEEICRL